MFADLRLDDRGVVRVSGSDSASFLQGLLTNDVERLENGASCYAALLSPQGKILFDLFIFRLSFDDYLIDVDKSKLSELLKRFSLYKLRADVSLADASATHAVVVSEAGEPVDPRRAGLGRRALTPRDTAPEADGAARAGYDERRIALEAPQGGLDFAFGDVFPHDVNMDLLNGVDFTKGCFVGQEVVSRMKHRGEARKRIVGVEINGPTPSPGTPIVDGDLPVGTMGGAQAGRALALVRLDRVDAARAAGRVLTAGSAQITLLSEHAGAAVGAG